MASLQIDGVRIGKAVIPKSWFSKQNLLIGLSAIPGGVVFLLAYFKLADFGDTCVVHRLTGYWCPLCGGTRATRELLQGHFHTALSYNPFALVTLAVIAYLAARWLYGFWKGELRTVISAKEAISYAAVATGFGIVRNLPGMWVFLSPLLGPAG